MSNSKIKLTLSEYYYSSCSVNACDCKTAKGQSTVLKGGLIHNGIPLSIILLLHTSTFVLHHAQWDSIFEHGCPHMICRPHHIVTYSTFWNFVPYL